MADLRLAYDGSNDPLIGAVVELPEGAHARVLLIEHEYDDGTTLEYVDGPYKGSQTMRDTFLVRRYPVIDKALEGR